MKGKVKKILGMILIVLIIIILLLISYFMLIGVETKTPKQINEDITIETREFMQRKVFIVTPNEKKDDKKIILYFHGGAYMAEASKNHWEFIEKLVLDTNYTVVMPDYPLTPKYNYKDVFNMVTPLYKEIIDKVDVENLILMGDSAGGGLALALEEKLSEEKEILPGKTILISPWLDARLKNEKIDEVQKNDNKLKKETLKLAAIAYAGEDGMESYLVNPIEGNLSKLRNITIFTGTYDILNPDVHVLEEKAKKQNVLINIKEYEEAKHIWLIDENLEEELVKKGYSDLLKLLK